MTLRFRCAEPPDVESLLPLMREFYVSERLHFSPDRSRRLLIELIADERLGRLIVIEDEPAQIVGYMVLGFGFSIEFHGRNCLLDEFYIVPERRGAGIGTAAVEFALKTCREMGIAAIHLEADHFNVRAHEFYKRLGFKDHERHLMTLWL
jgi:GNAT superfamily N-acetyltransferase